MIVPGLSHIFPEGHVGGIDSDTLYGTLNLLVLQALRDGPLHGLGVSRRLDGKTGGLVRVEEGALYPALHRLERDGLVQGEWGRTDQNRRAKFYRLTRKGRRQLDREAARWVRHTQAVAGVLGLGRPE
jgi:transcriptional regulator